MPSALFRAATCTAMLASLVLVAAPTATHAQANIPVTNCNDSGAGSLRSAVARAASGDTVSMTGLSCGRIELTSGPITITQDALRLLGPGQSALVLDGNYLGSVLRHGGSGTLSIERMAIEHGKRAAPTPALGGCVYSSGNLDIRHSHIRHCVVSGQGGAFTDAFGAGAYAAGDAFVYYSRIHSNTAHGQQTAGGGIFARGRLTVSRSSIVNNNAGQGGGLYADGGLTTNYVSVSGNLARRSGGGLAAQGEVSIANSAITGNRTDGLAGGVEVWGDGMQLIANSTISGNQANLCYSAVMMRGANSTIANSTIAFNEMRGNLCRSYPRTIGAVRAIGTLHLQSTIIANNIGPYGIGGDSRTDTVEGDDNLIMQGSRLALPPDTVALDPMLVPLADNGGVTKTHALVQGSPAINRGNNTAGLAYDQRGVGHPRVRGPQADIGAFEGAVPPSKIAVTNCNDAGAGSLRDAVARASTRGTIDMSALGCGKIILTSGVIGIPQADLLLQGPGYDRLTISGNDASQVIHHSGAGQFGAGTLRIHDLTVAYGTLQDFYGVSGGCIRSQGRLEITNSQIHHCRAESTVGSASGGGISAAHVTLTTSAVFANAAHAPSYDAISGGIHAPGGLVLDRSVLCDNVADDQGGGATVGDGTPSGTGGLTMEQSIVCRNTAATVAAVDVWDGPVSISHSTISDNRGLNGFGGVAITGDGDTMISNSTFSGNTSARYASALYLARYQDAGSEQTLSNSTVAFNHEQTLTDGRCYGAVGVVGLANLQSNVLGNNTCADGVADLGGRPQWGDAVEGADNLIMSSSLATPPDTLASDPRLAPLADNGGRTQTHALRDGSPAINTGNNAAGLLYDQRGAGFPREKGPRADIGAYER